MNMTMKRITALLLVSLVALTYFVLLQTKDVNGRVQAEDIKEKLNTITVLGEGEITVNPDVAFVTIAVETKGDTASEAQEENAKIIKQVESVILDTYKLKDEDIQTTSFNVYPRYQYTEKDAPKLLGYESKHSLQITYRNIDQIGELVDDLTKAGVNRVDHISFNTEIADEYELAAIENAMANAEEKAGVIAKSENKTIKGIIHVVQGNPTFDSPINFASQELSYDAYNNTSIASGQIKITANVSVQYEY
ncbi:SIMPL domain-containing protein [Chengkuizengella axinellae]|uniref:SIMPL domain-containing protein n=1 Tax=Chengkuizengella axinellae TaxID=3064388 RepID=A0ABT9J2L8_9BACL|nr:SIMPL domain-containing protein [Chengkuizengella sp. 2205SS18-9]MDP5275832.1 SIMPL domain-containing protein [Chengkuizengella sp. 2205SS18-9]